MVSSISTVSKQLEELKKHVSAMQSKQSYIQSSIEDVEHSIEKAQERVDNYKLIEAYLMEFADARQAQVYRQIEETVSEGLRTIFNEDLRLDVSNKTVGSRSETVFSISSQTPDGELLTDIMGSRGGGVAAITGLLIQAVLVILTPGLRPIIFCDESLRNVSEEYLPATGQFIVDLCERTGVQIVLVTHQPTIAEYADVHYSFSQSAGITKIVRER